MSPTPSMQDDISERNELLYAIVGRVDKFFPEITVRTFNVAKNIHITLDPCNIFDNPFENVDLSSYPLHNVEVR